MNALQDQFEYEFLPTPDHGELFEELQKIEDVDREAVRSYVPNFLVDFPKWLEKLEDGYNLPHPRPDQWIIVSEACFSDNFYNMRENHVSVIALGNWQRSMAPPSLFEFIQTLIVRESIAGVCPALRGSVHLGTRGCICDFTAYLEDTRLKVLSGFICHSCEQALAASSRPTLATTVRYILNKKWVGNLSDPTSTTSVLAKLRYNLFLSTGLKPTFLESTINLLQTEGVKALVTLFGAVALAGLLFFFGLKSGGS